MAAQSETDDNTQPPEDMLGHVMRIRDLLLNSLKEAFSRLPVPSTEQECLQAAQDFVNEHKRVIGGLTKARKELVDRFDRDWGDNKQPQSWSNEYSESIGEHDDELLQLFLHKMLQGQDETVKVSVLAQIDSRSDHLGRGTFRTITSPGNTRPTVTLQQHRQPAAAARSGSLPIEIAAMIFSHLDLESAVKLRQVSSSWYTGYQTVNHVHKTNLSKRCPWFKPENEGTLQTWADCVLVFVSRLKNKKKWRPFKTVDRAYNAEMEVSSHTAIALKIDDPSCLPANFEHIDNQHFFFRAKTYIVEDSETRLVIKHDQEDNLTLTLPPGTSFHSPVRPLKQHIQVRIDSSSDLHFPRDKPLHYENALTTKPGCRELGHFFCKTRKPPKFTKSGDQRAHYQFLDPYTGEFHQVGDFGRCHPMAVHNGLIWWQREENLLWNGDEIRNTIPTFVDLQTNRMYCRKDKIIAEAPERFKSLAGQCQNTRFVARGVDFAGRQGLSMLDLETGTVTIIQDPYKSLDDELTLENTNSTSKKGPTIFAGHVGDKFQALYVDHETAKKYETREREKQDRLEALRQGQQ